MRDKNKLKAELQALKVTLAELKALHDRGKIDVSRYLDLKKEYETHKAELEQELDSLRDRVQTYNNRGFDYYKQNDYEQAIANYDKAIELDPDYAIAYCNRGYAYFVTGCEGFTDNRINMSSGHKQSLADFQRYLELNPTASDRKEIVNLISDIAGMFDPD